MEDALQPRVIKAGPYLPTSPRTGNIDDQSSFRMNNLIVRGRYEGRRYWEVFTGLGDLGENVDMVALTGTLQLTADSTTVVGDGTLFLDETHLGQRICAIAADNSASWLLIVRRVIDATHMVVWKAPDTTINGVAGWRMPRLFAV